MKKILFMTLAAILVLSVALVGCAGGGGGVVTPPTKIIVGTVRDLTSFLAFYDQFAGGPVYRAFNKTLSGGIFMSGYNKTLPVELIIRPYNPATSGDLAKQTAAVIDTNGAHFVWGGPGTTTIYVMANVCNQKGKMLTTLEGGATDMMRDPAMLAVWPYTFVNLAFSDWYEIPVLYSILKEQSLPGGRAPKAWVLYYNNEHGQEYLEVTEEVFGAGNVTAMGHGDLPTQTAITSIVNQAKTDLGNASNPNYDIFCAFTYDPILKNVLVAFNATGFNPPAIIMGPGAQGNAYLQDFAPWLNGIMGFAVATNKTVISQNVTMSLSDMFVKIFAECQPGPWPGSAAYDPWGDATIWAGLEMWKVAVETVGELNSGYTARMRDVLAGFNSTNPCTTVIGDTWYKMFGAPGLGGGVMDYMCMPGQIGQWQNATGLYLEVIGYSNVTSLIPKYYATANVVYPMTDMWGW